MVLTIKDLKIKLIKTEHTFTELVKADGRSQQYLFRETKKGNQKVLSHLMDLIDSL